MVEKPEEAESSVLLPCPGEMPCDGVWRCPRPVPRPHGAIQDRRSGSRFWKLVVIQDANKGYDHLSWESIQDLEL